ncbi:hypothetical protein RB195_013941 [Necator americanus]|uniref:Uncharacterized protein n=1 Tax=Necator americanus TaxID=51031 RepID=A0ABR1DXW4_NECAM
MSKKSRESTATTPVKYAGRYTDSFKVVDLTKDSHSCSSVQPNDHLQYEVLLNDESQKAPFSGTRSDVSNLFRVLFIGVTKKSTIS